MESGTKGPAQLEKVLRGLTASQLEAVTSDAAPLCVIAGAGSGKTRVLTHRVARRVLDGSIDPNRALVLTFTRKASDELTRRLRRFGVADGVLAGTFHAVAFAQLRRHWADTSQRVPAIIQSPDGLVRRILGGKSAPNVDRETIAAISGEISWARARIVSPGSYPDAARRAGRNNADPAVVSEVFEAYRVMKTRRGVMDLDDLVESCAALLEQDGDFSRAQRWLFRHFFVDEFQDLNPAQWRLLEGWLGDRDDLFVVGDPLQAVYSWNGADPELLNRIDDLLPGTTILRLDDNHRCTEPIVNLARAALGTLIGSAQIKSVRDDPGSLIEIGEFEDDETESIALARWLRERHAECGSWSSLAVLARTNARLMPVAEALERAGIPVIKRGQSVSPSENAVLALLKQMPPSTPLRSAFADLSAELEDLGWLADEIESICSDIPDADIGQLLAWRAAASFAERSGVDGVQLSTFHRAKGLEWRSVAVVGLEAGMVPISHATRSAALEEERRLLYVALTRAERDLWCSWARQRMVFGKSWSCDPSPYVAALRQASPERQPHDPVATSTRIAGLRSALTKAV